MFLNGINISTLLDCCANITISTCFIVYPSVQDYTNHTQSYTLYINKLDIPAHVKNKQVAIFELSKRGAIVYIALEGD